MKQLAFLAALVVLISGCTTVQPTTKLPTQNLEAQPAQGKTPVVFYNNSNPLYLDGSWRIGISVNGEGVENLHLRQYVQLFLAPGKYRLGLSHRDIFRFNDEYDLEVGTKPMYVEVFNGMVSTKLEIHLNRPEGFANTYEPSQPGD
jgi:hypothetical protein